MANKPTLIKGLIKIDVAIQTIGEATKNNIKMNQDII